MIETYQAALHAQIEDLSLGDRLGAAEAFLAEIRRMWLSALPELPADGVCECGNDGLEFGAYQQIEVGYTRWTNGEWDEDHLHLSTDGWDDMSESGDTEWVECNSYRAGQPGCGKQYRMPENVEWD